MLLDCSSKRYSGLVDSKLGNNAGSRDYFRDLRGGWNGCIAGYYSYSQNVVFFGLGWQN